MRRRKKNKQVAPIKLQNSPPSRFLDAPTSTSQLRSDRTLARDHSNIFDRTDPDSPHAASLRARMKLRKSLRLMNAGSIEEF